LVSLYNKTRPIRKESSKSSDELPVDVEELAFVELIAYIEDILEVETAVLTLSELVRFYQYKLKELEADCGKVNSTRLKERVLKAFHGLTAHAEGRETNLVSRHVIGGILTEVKNEDSDAYCLARAAHIVRKDLLNVKNSFNGTFQEECQKHSIPASLLTLIGMLIKGPSTKSDPSDSQSCISIAQLVVFNSVSRSFNRPDATGSMHHIRSRECPLPIYIALKIHGCTRDRSFIDAFYSVGMCISYDRLLTVSTEITNSVLDR
jgi:hypothetical protein